MDKMEGLIPMRFFNAMDRNPISGASIAIGGVDTFVTDNKGKIVVPSIPDGSYTLTFSKAGFITTPINFRVSLGGVDFNWYSISPEFAGRDYRIVLDWGEKPADLDLHFVKQGGSGSYHISYMDMRRADDGNAILDRDDLSGYGPETITIGRTDSNAAYTCYVHDYTNRSSSASAAMARAGAVVRVYGQNRLLHTFHIPPGSKGITWNIFKIERGAIVPVNKVN
jgi:hypothetical protein